MTSRLDIGFLLDRQWHLLRGEMEYSKRPALLSLAKALADAAVPYAVIGGIALQVHQDEPRTTLDIDIAVTTRELIPRAELIAAGFAETGRYSHSDNWVRRPGNRRVPRQSPSWRTPAGKADEAFPVGAKRRRGDLRLRPWPRWIGPDGTPVQFTDDAALAAAIERAAAIDLDGVPLRVIRQPDLLHEKLRAGRDPARRRSKRLQDLADAQSLLESDPSLGAQLTAEERAILDQLPP